MKHLGSIVLLICCFTAVSVEAKTSSLRKCFFKDEKILRPLRDYLELDAKRRSLPEGTFDTEIASFNGKMHQSMAQIGEHFGNPRNKYKAYQVRVCLGPPNATLSHMEMKQFLSQKDKTGDTYLIYHWRGWHDFLFFPVRRGRIVGHGWWFAYE
jgi:hypothetical protein